MLKYVLTAALVSTVVSGCVTSDRNVYSQATKPRPVQDKRTAEATAGTVRSAQPARQPVILGAAY
jgi:outer membrane lipoprotein SlyB